MTTIPVDFAAFCLNHPGLKEFDTKFKDTGKWPKKWETCAARLSCAFNATQNDAIAKYDYPDKWSPTGKARAQKIDGAFYLLAVHDVQAYLSQRYGDGDSVTLDNIKGRTGILTFGRAHVDVWNNSDTNHPTDLKHEGEIWNKPLLFWDVGIAASADDDSDN